MVGQLLSPSAILEEGVEALRMLIHGLYHVLHLLLEEVLLIVMEALSCIVAPNFVSPRGYEWKGTSLGSLALLEAFEATLTNCAFPKVVPISP